ncbi:proline dehydrogenase [Pendulispora rubella]|uniref:Proline dehydrogenase n=1 Tax=Pendulispora rubella TaxID=2741070 RepID=A0ABZ2KZP0_9BACT
MSRLADLRRILDAARGLVERRAALIPELVQSTGLSPEGVEHALLHHLETDATEDDLRTLLAGTVEAPHVHVILSANVFVAALRAIVLARAAAPTVTVRPSSRDPAFALALLRELADPAITPSAPGGGQGGGGAEIHVYGRDETIAQVRASAPPGTIVRGHGAGIGVAVITESADLDAAAEALADDVIAFDQRGCLSPRIAFVVANAAAFAEKLHAAITARELRVPRGELSSSERADAQRYADTVRFAGTLHAGRAHLVGVAEPLLVPPSGRHLHVMPIEATAALPVILAPLARSIVAIGLTDPAPPIVSSLPGHARISALGRMQRPPLDGPVDRRPSTP